MRHTKLICCIAALLLCVSLSAAALAGSDGALTALWKSGCDLLFHTDDVTVKGEAVFYMDGQRFKTAKLHYVQDGYRSYYDWALSTPKADGTERQSGWTIIADEQGNYYVMEVFYPGIYRSGIGSKHNTLLRQSVQLDALVELGGVLTAQIEPTLPEGTVTMTESDGGKAVHFAFAQDQLPDAAVSALNLAATYLCNRWFSYGYDRAIVDTEYGAGRFENYITPTQALTDGTVKWALRGVEADFALDAESRLTQAKGSLTVDSIFWDGAVRAIRVDFDFAFSDYGASHVRTFNPAEYNVVTPYEFYGDDAEQSSFLPDDETWKQWLGRAVEALESQGFAVNTSDESNVWFEGNIIGVSIETADRCLYFCAFQGDGALVTMQDLSGAWIDAEEAEADGAAIDEAAAAEAAKCVRSFLEKQNPALAAALKELKPASVLTDKDGGSFYSFHDYSFGETHFVVQVAPLTRIVYYSGTVNPS